MSAEEEEKIQFSSDSNVTDEAERKRLNEIYGKIKDVLGDRPMVIMWAEDWESKPSLLKILSNLPQRERHQMIISFLERDLGLGKLSTEALMASLVRLGGGRNAEGN